MQRLLCIHYSLFFLPPHSTFFNIFFFTLSCITCIFLHLIHSPEIFDLSLFQDRFFSPSSNLILLHSPSMYSTLLIIFHQGLAFPSLHFCLSLFFSLSCPTLSFYQDSRDEKGWVAKLVVRLLGTAALRV